MPKNKTIFNQKVNNSLNRSKSTINNTIIKINHDKDKKLNVAENDFVSQTKYNIINKNYTRYNSNKTKYDNKINTERESIICPIAIPDKKFSDEYFKDSINQTNQGFDSSMQTANFMNPINPINPMITVQNNANRSRKKDAKSYDKYHVHKINYSQSNYTNNNNNINYSNSHLPQISNLMNIDSDTQSLSVKKPYYVSRKIPEEQKLLIENDMHLQTQESDTDNRLYRIRSLNNQLRAEIACNPAHAFNQVNLINQVHNNQYSKYTSPKKSVKQSTYMLHSNLSQKILNPLIKVNNNKNGQYKLEKITRTKYVQNY